VRRIDVKDAVRLAIANRAHNDGLCLQRSGHLLRRRRFWVLPVSCRTGTILSKAMTPVTLYTTEHCSLCASAKTLLSRRGIEFEEINLARDPDGREELQLRTGMITFPQIVVGEQIVGGFRELLAADRAGRLRELIAAA
jgi:glutaredoxin 3